MHAERPAIESLLSQARRYSRKVASNGSPDRTYVMAAGVFMGATLRELRWLGNIRNIHPRHAGAVFPTDRDAPELRK